MGWCRGRGGGGGGGGGSPLHCPSGMFPVGKIAAISSIKYENRYFSEIFDAFSVGQWPQC